MGWIRRNQRNYSEFDHGLWIVETHDGEFVGDCGLTWQQVDDERLLEVGFHVARDQQGRGYATEAARSCVDLAANTLGASHLAAIINTANTPSRRVAQKLGMTIERRVHIHGSAFVVYGRSLAPVTPG